MKDHKQCCKCKSKDIYYLENPSYHDNATSFNMELGIDKSGLVGKKNGKLEAFICSNCGFVEFYIKDLSNLKNSKFAKKV